MVRIRTLPNVMMMILGLAGCGDAYDVVISDGRVMDPASGLDGVRNIGIRDGQIAAISEATLSGERTINATGHVVAPGFVDLHEHGQDREAYGLMVRDGVTSAFELEVGTNDVDGWYRAREGGQYVNHGVSIGHIQVRMAVMGDEGTLLPSGPGGHQLATETDLEQMRRRIKEGLDQGAVAVGFGTAYTPAATMGEIESMFRIAAERNASAHIHMRGGLAGLAETIETAKRAGVKLHVVHANSSGGAVTAEFLDMIQAAQQAGQDVTTEAYPYNAGMTAIESALFDDWEIWSDDQFQTFQWTMTGERLTRETFARYRAQGGNIIQHSRTDEMTMAAISNPITMIASDGFINEGQGHPRTSGTYAKVLGRFVREQGVLDLMDALRRMTIAPAERLETYVPMMRNKGRLAVGADADITIFNPETVIDRSTYMDATIPSDGIPYVLVNGTVVVDNGALVDVRPGRPVRVTP